MVETVATRSGSPAVLGEGFAVIPVFEPDEAVRFRVPENGFAFVFLISGEVEIGVGSETEPLAETCVMRAPAGTRFSWAADSTARAVIVDLELDFLERDLEPFRPGLLADVRAAVFERKGQIGCRRFGPSDRSWIEGLLLPPVQGPASSLWYRAKIQELLALFAFPAGKPTEEFFCSQQRRLARQRVSKVKGLLDLRLDEPLNLKRLADEVGCSSAYLCRTFSAETGMTISRYLRSQRVERAAQMIRSGRYNVSEAALEVGYQSLSHFSKVFQQELGCLPSRYQGAA